jgi:hypothetical protein
MVASDRAVSPRLCTRHGGDDARMAVANRPGIFVILGEAIGGTGPAIVLAFVSPA